MRTILKLTIVLLTLAFTIGLNAQKTQYSRSASQTGLNTFEPSKVEINEFDGLKLQIGGNF